MALDHKSTLAEQYFVLMWTRGLWCLSQPGLSIASGFLLASYLTHARFSPKPYSPQSSSLPQTQIMGSDFLSFSMKKSETLQHEFLLVPTSHSDTPLSLRTCVSPPLQDQDPPVLNQSAPPKWSPNSETFGVLSLSFPLFSAPKRAQFCPVVTSGASFGAAAL